VGLENLAQLRCLGIFVDQAAEDRSSFHLGAIDMD
jgi:hypothetical protein